VIYYVLSIEAGINSWNRTIYFVFPYLLELSNLIQYPVLNLRNEIILSLKKFLLFRIRASLCFSLVDCVQLRFYPFTNNHLMWVLSNYHYREKVGLPSLWSFTLNYLFNLQGLCYRSHLKRILVIDPDPIYICYFILLYTFHLVNYLKINFKYIKCLSGHIDKTIVLFS